MFARMPLAAMGVANSHLCRMSSGQGTCLIQMNSDDKDKDVTMHRIYAPHAGNSEY